MPTALLIVTEPDERARVVPITDAYVSIGRQRDNNVRIDNDEYVSRHHAMIERRGDGYWLSDLSSNNGTTVNGEPLDALQQLRHRDVIGIGEATTIEFRLSGSEQPADLIKTEAGVAPPPPRRPKPVDEPVTDTAPLKLPDVKKKPPLGAILAIIGILSLGLLVAGLYGANIIGGNRNSDTNDNLANDNHGKTNDNEIVDTRVTPEQTPPPTPPAEQPQTPTPTPELSEDDNLKAVQLKAPALAGQISGKSQETYKFDPAFIQLISKYLDEYKNEVGFNGRAKDYKEVVRLYFGEKRYSQLIPYILAMSQTRFKKGSGGVWFESLPPTVVSEAGGNVTDLDAVAMQHLLTRLNNFDPDDFMYAVACYGQSDAEAAALRARLENADPTYRELKERYDFWKMKNKGVVKDEQVKRVVKFFAAGIVCENPQYFRLKDKNFSSLIP